MLVSDLQALGADAGAFVLSPLPLDLSSTPTAVASTNRQCCTAWTATDSILASPVKAAPSSSLTQFTHLPQDLQLQLFALASAPLTTCKTSEAVAKYPD
jgi:hypothetical protein